MRRLVQVAGRLSASTSLNFGHRDVKDCISILACNIQSWARLYFGNKGGFGDSAHHSGLLNFTVLIPSL